jgi:ABC-type glycerol-3-phosphate transport system permease component
LRVHHVDYIHRGHDIGDVAMYLQACWLVAGCLADHDRPDQIAHDRHQPALGVLIGNPFGLPTEWQWSNYGNIIVSQRYWLQMSNSLVIAVLTVFLTLAFGAMAAFCFAHVRFLGSDYLLNYFLIGPMFPAATAILPLYIRIRNLGLVDTYWGVVLP